jgi:DNA repair exonuclease SbcCD ATPase subunit
MRSDLERQLAAATDPDRKADLTAQLDRVTSALKDAPQTHADAIKVKDRVTQSYQRIEAIEQEFRSTLNAMRMTRAYLRRRHQEAPDLLAQLQGKVDDAAKAAQDELDQAKATNAPTSTLDRRVKRISELRKSLANPTSGRALAQGAEKAAHSGLTDLPLWFVQAFTEQGWQWGEWEGFSDAMHFQYMGPVADVISQ